MVVFYHAAKGGSKGLIRGSPFPVSHQSCWGEAWGSPSAATGAGGHHLRHSIPRGPWSHHLRSTCSKALRPGSSWGLPGTPVPAEIPTRLAQGHRGSQATITPQARALASFRVPFGIAQVPGLSGRLGSAQVGGRAGLGQEELAGGSGFRRLSTCRRELPRMIQALSPAPQCATSSALELQGGDVLPGPGEMGWEDIRPGAIRVSSPS